MIDDDVYAIGEKYLIEDLKALRADLLTQTKLLLSQQPSTSQVPSKHLMSACMTLVNSLGHASSSSAAMWLLHMQSLSMNEWLRDVWVNYSLNPWSNMAYSINKLSDLHSREWPHAKRMVQVLLATYLSHLYIYLSIYISICLSIHLLLHLSIHLSLHSSIYLSIYPSLNQSINFLLDSSRTRVSHEDKCASPTVRIVHTMFYFNCRSHPLNYHYLTPSRRLSLTTDPAEIIRLCPNKIVFLCLQFCPIGDTVYVCAGTKAPIDPLPPVKNAAATTGTTN